MNFELKKCPLCGGDSSLFVDGGVKVICTKCGASSREFRDEIIEDQIAFGNGLFVTNSIMDAVSNWNNMDDVELIRPIHDENNRLL